MKRFLFSLILLPCLLSNAQKADLIVYNGKIATMQKPGEFKEAIAMKDGIILKTGSSAKILADFKSIQTILIDAKGKTVIPEINMAVRSTTITGKL